MLLINKYISITRLSSIIIGLNLICSFVRAQTNLVPNGSFENYSACPSGYGSLEQVIGWFQPNKAGGSSDAFNTCYFPTNPYMSVPFNVSFQYPRTGNGYSGIYIYTDTTVTDRDRWREYLEVGLTDTLISGKKYCVRLHMNKGNWSMWAIKNIQAVLTNDSLLYNDINYTYISGVTPIMEAPAIVYDTLNWVLLETTYTANGGEKFLTIGNFSPGLATVYQQVLPYSSIPNTLGYYLFDDISIYQQPDVFAGNDTIIPPGDSTQLGTTGRPDIIYSWSPSTGLNNPNIANPMATPGTSISYTLTVTDTNQLACTSIFTDTVLVQVGFIGVGELNVRNFGLQVYPNPFSEIITFKTDVSDSYEIKIFDVAGRQLQNILFEGSEFTLKNKELSAGTYFYEIKNKNDERVRGKFVKQ